MPRKAGRVPVSQARGHAADGRKTGAAGFAVAPGAGAAADAGGAGAGRVATSPAVSDAGGAADGVAAGAGDDGAAGLDGPAGAEVGGAGATGVRTCHAAPGVAAVHVTVAAAPVNRNDPSVTSIGARRPASSTTTPASGRAPSRAVPSTAVAVARALTSGSSVANAAWRPAPAARTVTTSPGRRASATGHAVTRTAPPATASPAARATARPLRSTTTSALVASIRPRITSVSALTSTSTSGGAATAGVGAPTPAMRVMRFAPASRNHRSPAASTSGESVRLRRAAGRNERPGPQPVRAPLVRTLPTMSPYSSAQNTVPALSTVRSAGLAGVPKSVSGRSNSAMPADVPGTPAAGSSTPTLPVALSVNHTSPRRSIATECGFEVTIGVADSSGSSTTMPLGTR